MNELTRHAAVGNQYAQNIHDREELACKWVRLACDRHLRDLDRQGTADFPYKFDMEKGSKVCRFIEHLKHVKGPLGNRNITLEPWQCWVVSSVFGWVHDRGPRDGKRKFRRSYVEVPRGNAKSTLSSGIGLYMLSADGEAGAEVYSLATTRDQARIVARDAQHMARKSPDMMRALGVKVNAHNMVVEKTASKFEALSADGSTLDGLSIHFACVDELHAHRTRDLWDVTETGIGKRDGSLLWAITTAGSNRSGICYETRSYLTKVLEGVAKDETAFGAIWTIDEDDNWMEEASFRKANPNWGVSVQPDIVMQSVAKAMQMPAAQNNLKTKHLDVWVNADAAWMDMAAWDRMADPSLMIEDFVGESCTIGLDLATRTDMAAKVYIFQREIEEVTHYYLFGQFYLPESAVVDGRNAQYSGWEIEGRLTVTPGDVLDFGLVESELIEDSSRFDVREISYDPWQATQLSQRLQAQGANCIEFRNTVANFSAPMKEFDALIRSGRLHHSGCPVMSWMTSNVVAHLDAKENIYPRKERPENKIDGVVAALSALGRIMVREDDFSVYASRGPLFI